MSFKTPFRRASNLFGRAAAAAVFCLLATGLIRPAVAWAAEYAVIGVGGVRLRVELAYTAPARIRGLAGRPSLPPETGMLFLYPDSEVRLFWMAGMEMAIDLIWIDDGEIVGLVENSPPPLRGKEPASMTSPGPVDMVLEVPAGWASEHGVEPGDRVLLPLDLPKPE